MPKWEIEVTDGLTSWRCMKRTYYPGFYVTSNERLVEAARQTHYGVHVRPLDDGEPVAVGGVVADGETRPESLSTEHHEGPLTVAEIWNPEETRTCPTCGRDYKNREQHYRMKPDHRPGVVGEVAAVSEEPAVPEVSAESEVVAATSSTTVTEGVEALPDEPPAEAVDEPAPGEPVAAGDGS